MESNNELKALLKLWSLVLASLCYCYFFVSKLPIGKFRVFSLLPIFTLFTILPLSLSSDLPIFITGSFITWLGNFKLILYSFNHGPLSDPHLSLLNFLLIAAFPIRIKHPSSQIQKPLIKFYPFNFLFVKTLVYFIFVAISHIYTNMLHPFLGFVIYFCTLFLFLEVIFGMSTKFVGSILGVDSLPPSDEPYLATSLQDFWSYRWNLVISDALRDTIYNPTRIFLSNYLGRRSALVASTIAAFLVSGLMHELLFYYVTRVSPSWEVTWFFVLHGFCVVGEVYLKKVLGRKLRLHWAVSGPITIGFVVGSGYWLYFPPLARNNQVNATHVRIFKEVMALLQLHDYGLPEIESI